MRYIFVFIAPALIALAPACGDDDESGGTTTGGSGTTGGSRTTGGTETSGGSRNTGGTAAKGGSSGEGGAASGSGGMNAGGDESSGGSAGDGGNSTAGQTSNGGESNGGSAGAGGAGGDGGGGESGGVPSAKAISITVGRLHSCAVTSTGAVLCWGYAENGRLGNGVVDATSAGAYPSPVPVQGISSGATQVSSFGDHTCAVVSGGVKCWGANDQGQLGNGTRTESAVPVSVTGLTTGVAAVAAGDQHTCALTTAGAVKCWGKNDYGQLGDDSTVEYSVTPVDVSGLTSGVKSIAAGLSHACAVTSTNGAQCWGSNLYGELGIGESGNGAHAPGDVNGLTSGVTAVTAGDNVSCAITASGALKCWGKNADGQVGNGVSGTQEQETAPVAVSGVTAGATAVSSGYSFTCAVISGAAKCWGNNFYLVLGNGEGASFASATPVAVTGLTTGVAAIAASSSDHACALTSAGAVKCWGNGSAALGHGDDENAPAPVSVLGLP